MIRKLTFDCSALTNDNLLSISDFHTYLKETFKVRGRRNNLTDNVNIEVSGDSIVFECLVQFKKNYLRFLAKKFLHRKDLKDWVRIESSGDDGYRMAFYDVAREEDDA